MVGARRIVPLVVLAVLAAATAPAAAKDYAGTARNIVPHGQWGSVPAPPGADSQAIMYDGLTPLFNSVTFPDLIKYFKSEALGVSGPAPRGVEAVPRAGVKIVRDAFHVPHITATTVDGATWAAGWVTEEDRGLLIAVAKGPAYLAAVDAPGLSPIGIVRSVRSFTPSARLVAFVNKQTKLLQNSGPKGTQLLHDIDVFLQGINDRLKFEGSPRPPGTRADIYAANALLASFLGEGGGDEARRSEFLNGLRRRLGFKAGLRVFNDLRERNDPETSYSIDGRFPYGQVPRDTRGSVVLRNGSLSQITAKAAAAKAASEQRASNILMVSARRSANGHPLFVGGPQIGYNYPGLTLEMDVNAPGDHWRGATSVPFPGYLLIGRGEDFANTLTSANGDIIDLFAERLCGGDKFHYVFNGRCLKMGTFDAGFLGPSGSEPGREVVFRTTVHGPVVGYARTAGSPSRLVAISSKRSSRGREILFQLAFQDLSRGRVRDPDSFFKAFSQSPLTFNAFYADDQHIAEYTAGRFPLRAPDVDPSLPADGSGAHEWRGFLAANAHPHGTDPAAGVLTNWNNRAARDFRAADNEWGYSPIMRDELLKRGLAKHQVHNLATVVGAMNAAATQDVRAVQFVSNIEAILSTGAPNARDAKMVELLKDWSHRGGSRLDRDLDGKIDHPGAAILDAAWDRLANAVMTPVLGVALRDQLATLISRFDQPPGGQFSGWMGYMDKDIRTLLGRPVRHPFSRRYCGNGSLAACRAALWAALDAAGDQLQAAQGPHPAKWRADATHERIQFSPIPLHEMRYTNRPSGIQQVITFTGHRP